jgi:hypothetical protein
MKAKLQRQQLAPQDDNTTIFFNIFMALLAVALVLLIGMLFMA